jgi:hypothetical protein
MTFVQRAHGRHQGEGAAASMNISYGSPERGQSADNARPTFRLLGDFHGDVAA